MLTSISNHSHFSIRLHTYNRLPVSPVRRQLSETEDTLSGSVPSSHKPWLSVWAEGKEFFQEINYIAKIHHFLELNSNPKFYFN